MSRPPLNAAAAFLIAVVLPLRAADPKPAVDSNKTLNLTTAVARSLSDNPMLSAYSFERRSAEARRIRAGLRTNPDLGLEVENIPGSGSRAGADATESTLRLSQVVELGGKREKRITEAKLSSGLAAWDFEARRLDVLAETTRRFIDVAAAQERLNLAREAAALAKAELLVVTERVVAARTSVVEQKRAEIAVARASVDEGHAEHSLLAARKALAAMWGEENPAFGNVRADFFSHNKPETFGSLLARIGKNPDLARLGLEARLRDSQLRLARTRGIPDATLSAGIRQFADASEWAGVFGVSVPLPVFDRGQADVYEALQMRGKIEALGMAIRVQLASQLFSAYQELLHSASELDAMAKDILPAANEVLRSTEDGYKQGRFSYLELADARRSLIEVRGAHIEAAFNFHTQMVEIDRLIGAAALAPSDPEAAGKTKN